MILDKIHTKELCPKAKQSLEMVQKLREKGYQIEFDNTRPNRYKLSMIIGDTYKEYYYNVYQDMINTLDILLELEK